MWDSLPDTGTVVRRGRDNGEEMTAVAVTLPDEMWERITGHLNERQGWPRRDQIVSDLSLEERVAIFLRDQIGNWIMLANGEYNDLCGVDPNVPF
jgi:hypothetical protein